MAITSLHKYRKEILNNIKIDEAIRLIIEIRLGDLLPAPYHMEWTRFCPHKITFYVSQSV